MCSYCEGDVDKRESLISSENGIIVYIDGNNNLTVDDEMEDIKLNFCPICEKILIVCREDEIVDITY